MATHWTLGCDAADPHRIAAFWATALGYVPEPGYDDPDGASIVDPDGVGPAIGFLRVPEHKTAKNRMHIDIRVAREPPWDMAERWSDGPTAVLFWSPTCGFCHKMLPDLRAWETDPPADAPRLLVISSGSAEQNRAMGLTSPTLLDDGFAAGQAFGATGTPQAVLVAADGTVASEQAAGGEAVLQLLKTRLSPV